MRNADFETRIGGTLFYFAPNDVFVVSSVDQGIDFAVGVAMKQNAAFYTLAEKQIGRRGVILLFCRCVR